MEADRPGFLTLGALDTFFARVRAAPGRVLFLDYDGTIAPHRPDPRQATPECPGRAGERWERRGWGHRLDVKPLGLVLNGAGLSREAVEEMRREACEHWSAHRRAGLVVQESEYGIELRPGGRDKGYAVRTVLAEAGEGVVAAYLGDDFSDEEAFRGARCS